MLRETILKVIEGNEIRIRLFCKECNCIGDTGLERV
jgi:hypothetical protein